MRVTSEDLMILGLIPGVQNVSALVRLVHGVQQAARAVFMLIASKARKDKISARHYEAKAISGVNHIGRALLESIPIISSVVLLIYDFNNMMGDRYGLFSPGEEYWEKRYGMDETIFGSIKV